jgi:hypothetical protein
VLLLLPAVASARVKVVTLPGRDSVQLTLPLKARAKQTFSYEVTTRFGTSATR